MDSDARSARVRHFRANPFPVRVTRVAKEMGPIDADDCPLRRARSNVSAHRQRSGQVFQATRGSRRAFWKRNTPLLPADHAVLEGDGGGLDPDDKVVGPGERGCVGELLMLFGFVFAMHGGPFSSSKMRTVMWSCL